MKNTTVFFIVLFWGMGLSHAQMVNNRFQHITSDDGLSQNTVRCILQDKKGFLWFGTWNGLDRYDGYNFKVYKSNSNDKISLSGNFIHSLCQDRLGNLWIATNNGLDKFVLDKEIIDHYRYNPRSNNSISSNKINCIIQDHLGNLWIGTDDRGIDKLVYNSGKQQYIRFKHYAMSPGIKSTFPGNQVSSILEDKFGNIWIGTSQGLCRFNPWNETVKIFQTSASRSSISNNQILSLYQDKEGIIWVGTLYGLNKKSISSDLFTRYFNNPDNKYSLFHNTVTSIIEDKEGNLIIGTLGGICKFNRRQNNFTGYKHNLDDVNSLNNDFVNCLYSDRDGVIWIGTDKGGVNKYNIYQKKFEYYRNNPSDKNSLSHNTINSVYEDKKFLWIGTAGGGLNLYDKQRNFFRHYVHLPHQVNSISSDFITSIFRDSEGNTWLGTWGQGLNKIVDLENQNGSFSSFQHNENNSYSLINNFVSSIFEDKHGNLWVGTQGGLDIFDRKSKRFIHPFNTRTGSPAFNEVGCLKQDKEGNLWVGTKFGLYEILATEIASINYNNVKLKTVYYSNNYSDKFSLSGNYVISMAEDSKGNLWFGTYGNGVDKLVYGKNHKKYFVNYTENNGLANNVVYGILEDEQGNIWFSTDNGLSKFYPKTNSFRNYYVSDGLQSNQFYWTSCFKNPEGKMYFGSINGLTAFKLSDLHKNMQKAIPVVIDFKINNVSVPVGILDGQHKSVLQKSIAYIQKIVLSYKDNDISFDFSAMNNVFPEKNQYAYHLEGFESKWNYVSSNRRYAHYTNLKGGKYVFQVKAANCDGVWNNTPVSLQIVINPPFWDTWWFKTIMILSLFFILIVYVKTRTIRLELQNEKLEKKVSDRTLKIEEQKQELLVHAEKLNQINLQLEKSREEILQKNMKLESQNKEISTQRDSLTELNKKVMVINQIKLRFFTNISHEFKTPLTLIIDPLEELISECKGDGKMYDTLLLIRRNAMRLLFLINQLMDFRKIETNKLDLKVSKADLVDFLDNVYSSFDLLAKQKQINYNFKKLAIEHETWFDPEKVEKIIFNLLSNAFKYTPKGGEVTLSLYVPGTKENVNSLNSGSSLKSCPFVEIIVSDTGMGIPAEHLNNIFKRFYRVDSPENNKINGSGIGLSITRELVKAHHGQISVESTEGKGSTFKVRIPFLKEFYSENEIVEETDKNLRNNGAGLFPNELDSTLDQNPVHVKKAVNDNHKPIILVVEDNYDLRSFIAKSLSKEYQLLEAGNGKEAYDLVKTHSVDLVISDIMMPEMDGLELCSRIKNNLLISHVPVILLTARTSVENLIEGLETGADDYISKPFNFNVLKVKIKNILEARRKLKEHYSKDLNVDPMKLSHSPVDEKFLSKAIEIVRHNYANSDFGVEIFAEQMNISRSLLHKKLSALTDFSAGDFITSVRLKKAAELLHQPDKNISDVAYEVGFNDPKYFSRIFKKYFGTTPTEYIKN